MMAQHFYTGAVILWILVATNPLLVLGIILLGLALAGIIQCLWAMGSGRR